MAFKILSSDEIELLTEEQRKSYESELEIYNERVKFVEQLEKFENTVVSPYEPKLVNISDVKKAPKVAYAKPEYVVELVDIDVNSAPEMSTVKFDKPVTATVPKCLKTKSVSVEHIKQAKCEQPIIPKVSKTVVPEKTIEKFEKNKPELPQVKGTVIPTKVHKIQKQDKPLMPLKTKTVVPCVTPKKNGQVNPSLPKKIKVKKFNQFTMAALSVDEKAMTVSIFKKNAPKVNLPNVVMPEKINPILPKASVEFAEIKNFKGFKRRDIAVPKAIIPNQVNASFKQVNHTKAELPYVSNISVKKASIKRIDVKKAELPIAQKTDVPVKNIHKSAYGFSDVPTIDVQKINVGSYIKPEFKKSELPNVNKPVVNPSHFIKKSAIGSPKIEYPIIDIVPKTSFKKIDRKIGSVPSISGITIPNAYANDSLKNLL